MVQLIDTYELKERLDEGDDLIVVNVLAREEYEREHIPGSINIPLEELDELMDEQLPEKDRPVVVHCSGPSCSASAQAAKKLELNGYENVIRYEEGMQGWKQAEFEREGDDVSAAV